METYTFQNHEQTHIIKINIIDTETFQKEQLDAFHHSELLELHKKPKYCRAFLLKDNIIGNFHIIQYDGNHLQRHQFGFCLDRQTIVFIDDSHYVQSIIEKMQDFYESKNLSTVRFLHDFIAEMIKDDSLMIADLEESLNQIEDCIVKNDIRDIEEKISRYRYRLLKLGFYYHQLEETIDTLLDNEYGLLSQGESFIFKNQERRVNRLSDHIENLRQYTSQLNDMYNAKMNTKQNHAINVLTILTSIFFPLSLITGWYGMNFTNMPELQLDNGYFIIIGVSILLVIGELIVLKIKKII